MYIYLPIAEMSVNIFLILGMGGGIGFLSGVFGVGGVGCTRAHALVFPDGGPQLEPASKVANGKQSHHKGWTCGYEQGPGGEDDSTTEAQIRSVVNDLVSRTVHACEVAEVQQAMEDRGMSAASLAALLGVRA